MAAYATAAQLLSRYDSRRVAELNSDTGTAVTPTDPVSVSSPVGAALYDASAMLDSALQSGRRYSRTALATLVADADASKGSPIVRMVCDIAMARLLMRRGLPAGEIDRQVPGYKDALTWMQRLANGEDVLDIAANLDAGLPEAALTDVWDVKLTSNFNGMFGRWGYERRGIY